MELETIEDELKEIIGTNSVSIKCYLFGSILTNARKANDIDLLVIYENDQELATLKYQLRYWSAANPLHLTCFSIDEERELNFVKQQQAKSIN